MTLQARSSNTKTPNPVGITYIKISWIHYQGKKDKVGQSLGDWENENEAKLLYALFKQIDVIQNTPYLELIQKKYLKLYNQFPDNKETDFRCPDELEKSENWGTIRKLHQESRVAGFLRGDVFYIVFLDKNHKFSYSQSHQKHRK